MDYTTFTVYFFLAILANAACQNATIQRTCDVNAMETCKVITDCPTAMDLLIKNKDIDNSDRISKLRKMFCGFLARYPMVCCPSDTNGTIVFQNKSDEVATNRPKLPTSNVPEELPALVLRTTEAPRPTEMFTTEIPMTAAPAVITDPFPDRSVCGQITTSDKIIGGVIAAIDDFPWLGRIKYINNYEQSKFLCSASLITNRYAISAAHCFTSPTFKPVSLRFGEWNTESPNECFDGMCPDPPVEVDIEAVSLHPKHSKLNFTDGDIAVIRLSHPLNFTDFVQPICLPTTKYVQMQDYLRESTYWTAGWGVTEFDEASAVKRKVQLDAVPINICRTVIPRIPASSGPNLICAGGRLGKDSCKGDSGGPLMREVQENYRFNWYLYGITSFGSNKCGTEGVPGIYTRVSVYMDWIRSIVKT